MLDLRLAVRSLRRTPLVTAVAVVSLALGLGANAAIFSIFEQILLRPLPVERPHELVNLSSPGFKHGSLSSSGAGSADHIFSYPMFRDLQAEVRSARESGGALEDLAAHRSFGVNLADSRGTMAGDGMLVSGSYFEVLGLAPALGRLLRPDDTTVAGESAVAVLGHSLWRQRYASDPDVLGETLRINGQPLTIVGVAPRGFRGTTMGGRPDVYVPITLRPQLLPTWPGFDDRQAYWAYVFGRLAPERAANDARSMLEPAYQRILAEVEVPLHESITPNQQQELRSKPLLFTSGARGQSSLVADVRTPLLVLLGVTGLVVLIAGANLANLLLVRASDRAGEIAIRLSIGAPRTSIVGQLVLETLVLASAGCLAGLLVAWGGLRMIATMLPEDTHLPIALELSGTMGTFLVGLVLLMSLVGLVPALRGTRPDLVSALRGTSGQTSGSRATLRARSVMATVQIALSVALLVAAGLFVRSLMNIESVDLGFDTERLATFTVSPERNGMSLDDARALFARLEGDVMTIPGVSSVTAGRVPLVAHSNWGGNVTVEGYPTGPDVDDHSFYNAVGPDYVRTLGIPLLAGRDISIHDDAEAPRVAVVNQAFVEKFQLGREAVGTRMASGGGDDVTLDIEIVGVVADAAYSEVKGEAPPLYVIPYRQEKGVGRLTFYVRTLLEPEAILGSIRETVGRTAPGLPMEPLRSFELQVAENIFLDRFLGALSTAFAALATLLAVVGLYGVLAYSVVQRRREIGLRMALGAEAARIRGLVLGQIGRMLAIGTALGLLAALGLGRLADSLLFELEGHDPLVLVAATVIVGVAALGAGLLPALRASRIDPMIALREE